ncbi:hypothetical protein HMPREF0983_01709 [Erysipelotrichaceae bacterium 3_1_53]|nr:hypothetical protein HMPREF0983_01709 [Erysipelotrichaceae bacterium 3_1_53]
MRSSYIYAEGKEPENTQGEIKAEEKEVTQEAQEDTQKDAKEKSEALSMNANDVIPFANDGYWEGWDIRASSKDMWSVDDSTGTLMVNKGGDITIAGTGNMVTNTIRVDTNDTVYLRINSVEMEGDKIPIDIQSGLVYLELIGNNTLQPWSPEIPGITVSPNAELCIMGDGKLQGGKIGSQDNMDCGFIMINSGSISVQSVLSGAAIGGGKNSSVDGIVINGGTIEAISNGNGAAIGAGEDGKIKEISIHGGDIKAKSNDGAAIGGGKATAIGNVRIDKITITGGNVKAYSQGFKSAGIGGGENATVENVTITGGTISIFSMGAAVGQAVDIGGGYGLKDQMGDFWLSGGSLYSMNKMFSNAPLNNDIDRIPVFCLELPNQAGTKNIKVDKKDYNITSNHEGYRDIAASDSFYLYLPGGKNHIITVTDAQNNVTHHEAVWDNKKLVFTLSDDRIAGDFLVEGGTKGVDWDLGEDYLVVLNSGDYSVSMLVDKTDHFIRIFDGVEINLTINDLNIEHSTRDAPGILIENNTKLILNLVGTNRFINNNSNRNDAGIIVRSSSSLVISGDGTLICNANSGAGIGGGNGEENGSIVINSGTINATSVSGAGIGGGSGAAGTDITINGGNVTASSSSGSGIGGGSSSYGQNIEIKGGTVTAKSTSGDGIGSGASSSQSSSNIYIGGGSVKASGGNKDISIVPKNSASGNQEVALYEMKNQSSVNTIKIDNISYKVAGYHDASDKSYYLYMTKEDHTIVCGSNTYTVGWDATNKVFKLKPPKPVATTIEMTANSITLMTPLHTETYGAAQFSLDGKTWQTSKTFSNLKAATTYKFYVKYGGNADYTESEVASGSAITHAASYTITIPSTMTAGGTSQNIAVNTAQSFVLGYGGQVNVKVTSGMTSAGIMTLTRTSGTSKPTISSQFKVNNANFTNTNNNVATFKTKTDTAVPISFAKPTHTSGVVPAGVYSGTVVFTMTYTQ